MEIFLVVLVSVVLLYLMGMAGTLITAMFIVRRKLREYQESGPFGY